MVISTVKGKKKSKTVFLLSFIWFVNSPGNAHFCICTCHMDRQRHGPSEIPDAHLNYEQNGNWELSQPVSLPPSLSVTNTAHEWQANFLHQTHSVAQTCKARVNTLICQAFYHRLLPPALAMTLSSSLVHCLLSPSLLHLHIHCISILKSPPKFPCLSSTPVLFKSLPGNQLGHLPTCKTQALCIQTSTAGIHEAFPTASLHLGTDLFSPKGAPLVAWLCHCMEPSSLSSHLCNRGQ